MRNVKFKIIFRNNKGNDATLSLKTLKKFLTKN